MEYRGGTLSSVVGALDSRSPHLIVVISLVAVFGLGLIDYASGPDLAFSVFYLLPISAVGWRFGFRGACGIAGLSALVWLSAELGGGEVYSSWLVPAWNTATRFGVFLVVASLIHGIRRALREQEALAQRDPLTGVNNPRAFNMRAAIAIDETKRRHRPVSLAYIDVDDFKAVNDQLGHSGGDRVLQAVGSALEDVTRESDVVGRLGGDEFAVLMPATGSRDAKWVLSNLPGRVYSRLDDLETQVTFSAGGVTFLTPPDSVDDMINAADALMYEAKRGGKSGHRHVILGGEVPSAVEDRSDRRPVTVGGDGQVTERSTVVDLR